MSFNRSTYDPATYSRHLRENVSVLSYVLNEDRYENVSKHRHELGLVGGAAVSHIKGNLVDLESELRGQTRLLTQCAAKQARPLEAGAPIKNDKTPPIATDKVHLRPCQMISYRAVPLPPGPRV